MKAGKRRGSVGAGLSSCCTALLGLALLGWGLAGGGWAGEPPRLLWLTATTEADPEGTSLRPPFDPALAHYGVACGEEDLLQLRFGAPPGLRLGVDGVQPQPGPESGAATAVAWGDVVTVRVAADSGAYRDYLIRCLPPSLAALRPTVPDGTAPPDTLLAVVAGDWLAVLDGHGAARFAQRVDGSGGGAGFFLRPFLVGGELRWTHARRDGTAQSSWEWVVRDQDFQVVRVVKTAPPLTHTGRHDFRLLGDGSALLLAHEPAVRDLSHLGAVGATDGDGQPWGANVQVRDSVIQLLGPEGRVRWNWSSWGRIPLEDCTQHWFPGNYAHLNGLQWTERGVLASFRGCSTVLLLDPGAPPGQEILWRLGESNLAPEEWGSRGLGPGPLTVVGDPLGGFCGQHGAQMLESGNLLLFDNGVSCVVDPRTGEPLMRRGGNTAERWNTSWIRRRAWPGSSGRGPCTMPRAPWGCGAAMWRHCRMAVGW
ncbi:MAG: hypothetical protein F4Z75_09675 [Synechococcus sp. SB0668_bin_15]|nr:hypothetical protein [Synechococcus sp. SB0668_bin_15]MYC49136.1 hypothetical protein [Synechococcus sp. SB0662_bin_14]MYG47012.1 hypothetical protein [Synechococcus sp. SB0675_bin_6]MYJ59864.1 hypothetical protein [Synechococcus sp. SB0672_bin_6]